MSNAAADASSTTKDNDLRKRTKTLCWATGVIDNESKNTAKAYMKGNPSATRDTAATIEEDEKKPPAAKKRKIVMCGFCDRYPAALIVKAPERKKQALCLLHYYTTSAIQEGSEYVSVLNEEVLQSQLNGTAANGKGNNLPKLHVQDLFAEAFVQLQQELAQESLSVKVEPAATKKKNPRKAAPEQDPLGSLLDVGRNKKRQRKPPPPEKSNSTAGEGGFLRHVPLPERLLKTQQQQAKLQAEQLARMNRVAKTGQTNDNSRRREPTRRSIWNVVMDQTSSNRTAKSKQQSTLSKNSQKQSAKAKPSAASVLNNVYHEVDTTVDDVTCSCGSNNVSSLGNVTSRNQDVRKGEVWGSGDRSNDDVVLRYRCNQCGKTWQESG